MTDDELLDVLRTLPRRADGSRYRVERPNDLALLIRLDAVVEARGGAVIVPPLEQIGSGRRPVRDTFYDVPQSVIDG